MNGELVSSVRETVLSLKWVMALKWVQATPPVIHDSLFQLTRNFSFFIEVPCQTSGPTYYVNYITKISGSGFTAVGPGAQANNFNQPPARGTLYFSIRVSIY